MNLALTILAVIIWGYLGYRWYHRVKERKAFEKLSITPEALHDLMVAHHDVLVIDARQPLDLLADSQIIPGAQRISPEEAMNNPTLIPQDKELVVYCTCPSDKTSRLIALKAQSMMPQVDIARVRFLKGGLEAWKAKGFPVVAYDKTFHLDTGT